MSTYDLVKQCYECDGKNKQCNEYYVTSPLCGWKMAVYNDLEKIASESVLPLTFPDLRLIIKEKRG